MTKSRKSDELDVLIIGGGPAGLSGYLWCRDLGLSVLLIEKNSEFGGQLLSIYNRITNYLGRTATNGRELRDHFLSQIEELEKHSIVNCSVSEFDPQTVTATLSNGEIVTARTAIIGTGVRRRRLGVPGESEFVGRGILPSGARDKELVRGKRVAIIGGGDAALENAQILAARAEKVYVIHRGSKFSARQEFVEPAAKNPKVEFILNSTVTEFQGDERLTAVSIFRNSSERLIKVDAALIRIGVQPNTDFVADKLELDKSGYINVDHLGQTNFPNVFAVGDVACPVSPTIQFSTGSAAVAIKAIYALIYKQIRLQ